MADCDLCGVALPTLVPVKVYKPKFAHSYPEGMWQGLCEQCVAAAIKASEEHSRTGTCGTAGTCQLCGSIERLYGVPIIRPSFSQGSERDTAYLCKRCLTSIGQAKTEWDHDKAAHSHDHITTKHTDH
jgi:hypothetical protein